MWHKLRHLGISGKFLDSVRSLYKYTKSCIKLQHMLSDWFPVEAGVKQGCIISPLLFNLYINDLHKAIADTGKGIMIDDMKISMLMYADDVVLMAESENDLQVMLNSLSNWCTQWKLLINRTKSGILHFRPNNLEATQHIFQCGDGDISIMNSYKYLGLQLTDRLDLTHTAKVVAKSANRALGLLIFKVKAMGGVSYNCYIKLFDCLVWPVISYWAAIWGTRSHPCIDAVFNRACRFFMRLYVEMTKIS